ncbi:3'(2'),5'-bisphosphate nucleotidase CysQ [Actinobacillus succinogenes]|uniref:3'(2'),5'-bisphosphate nucleotidase CysQ n=1 Tax=Actinobacillus succinogenes (strain ATCC 55618 / DSM 22257 / CCUG 43843 / 130Z) TaxID=339671 RepID=A6VKV9_ACTSZ|nr:3'(2'),5'-bisphosphate nucleotidase CysQ [Actinobacillus succinogenes]ABR73606.1 3'(2'),5'-bisphosphate nucleotidase [Actinobacillus succinogenes 130Z]PHI39935.1 3'(2'),5'-bisphosphate nucleotidase CysQ [Actinobacillus succinogenes]
MQCTPDLLQAVIAISHQAGEHLKRFYTRSVYVHTKSDNTPVTEADLFVSRFLTEKLTALTPEIPVLSEENCEMPLEVRSTWREYWLIDPLDGTKHFINHTGQFAILIALIQHNRPTLGVIYAPITELTHYAMKNYGAFRLQQGCRKQLQARRLDLNKPLKIAIGSESAITKVRSILNDNIRAEFVVHGSSGLKCTMVADGLADCYIRLGRTGEWDTAAGELLLEELGGNALDEHYQPLTYNQRETFVNPDFVITADASVNWKNVFQFNLP